jgi:hypothetical protein
MNLEGLRDAVRLRTNAEEAIIVSLRINNREVDVIKEHGKLATGCTIDHTVLRAGIIEAYKEAITDGLNAK